MEPCITAGTGIEETGFGYTMSLVSGKYKMIILYWLAEYSVLRYNELKRRLGTISHKTLSLSLKELEADGLVQRTRHDDVDANRDELPLQGAADGDARNHLAQRHLRKDERDDDDGVGDQVVQKAFC